MGIEKHVPDPGSQQLTPPPVTAGQLLWQSLSLVQDGTHVGPAAPLDAAPLPPDDELLAAVPPEDRPLAPPLDDAVAS